MISELAQYLSKHLVDLINMLPEVFHTPQNEKKSAEKIFSPEKRTFLQKNCGFKNFYFLKKWS